MSAAKKNIPPNLGQSPFTPFFKVLKHIFKPLFHNILKPLLAPCLKRVLKRFNIKPLNHQNFITPQNNHIVGKRFKTNLNTSFHRSALKEADVISVPPSKTRSALLELFLIIIIIMGLLKSAYLQLWTHESLQDRGAGRYERHKIIPAQRGKILDREGNELANNITTVAVSLVGSQAQLTSDQKNSLAELLKISRLTLDEKQMKAKQGFIYLKRQIPLEEGRMLKVAFQKLNLKGIEVHEEYRRYYPLGEEASQLLGFVNLSGEAVEGLEFKFKERLKGTEGIRYFVKTGKGRAIDTIEDETDKPAVNGQSIQLTLDSRLQHVTYTALREAVQTHQADGGSAVILNAKTGEILSLANYPSFDPNQSVPKTAEQLRNRAVTDAFEPGSTIKPFTMSLALDKQSVSPKTIFSGQSFMVKQLRVNDGEHSHETMTLAEIMQYSSNVGAVRLSQKHSAQEHYEWLKNAGFGQIYTDLPINGMTAGILRPYQRWGIEEKATIAYGYGISSSLLQLARSYTVFTNHGKLLPLSLLKTNYSELSQGIPMMSSHTAHLIKDYMQAVTSEKGTAPLAQIANYTTAGKTGTARKQLKGRYIQGEYIASFVGFAPATDPKLIMAIMIDTPRGKSYYGGQVAAPVFSTAMSNALRVLNIMPDAPNRPVVDIQPNRYPLMNDEPPILP